MAQLEKDVWLNQLLLAVGDIGDELVSRLSKKARGFKSWTWYG